MGNERLDLIVGEVYDLRVERARLMAENARLREALTSISTLVIGWHDEGGFNRSNLCEAVGTARDALEGGGT